MAEGFAAVEDASRGLAPARHRTALGGSRAAQQANLQTGTRAVAVMVRHPLRDGIGLRVAYDNCRGRITL